MNFKLSRYIFNSAHRIGLLISQNATKPFTLRRLCSVKNENETLQISKHPIAEQSYSMDQMSDEDGVSYSAEEELIKPDEADILSDPNLSDEDRKYLKMMKEEYEVWKYADDRMPEYVTNEQWKLMLQTKTRRERIGLLTFFGRKLIERQKNAEMVIERKLAFAERKRREKESEENGENEHLIYAIGHNAIFRRFELQKMRQRFFNIRAQNAIVDGAHVVFDMSFMDEITVRERNLTVSQLSLCVDENRIHRQPSALIFTGVDEESYWFKKLNKFSGINDVASIVTEKNYLDLYPKEDLIYLSPDGDPMTTFDSNKVYIIGGFVDKPARPRLTLGKAKREGIKTARLPLDLYVKWETGSKYLCLNQVLGIFLDVNLHGNWYDAIIRNVPKRKITPPQPWASSIHTRVRLSTSQRYEFLEKLV